MRTKAATSHALPLARMFLLYHLQTLPKVRLGDFKGEGGEGKNRDGVGSESQKKEPDERATSFFFSLTRENADGVCGLISCPLVQWQAKDPGRNSFSLALVSHFL